MKHVILIALSSVFMAESAFAFKPATDEDRKPIQLLIDLANQQQGEINDAIADLAGVEEKIKRDGDNQQLKQQALEMQRAIESLTKERNLDRDKAIHYALIAYGIVPSDASDKPEMPSGVSVVGSFAGQNIFWRPIAEDNLGYSMPLPKGGYKDYSADKTKNLSGLTFPDGLTAIFAYAFQSPEFLAITLDHEKEHFDQRTTLGRGDKMSHDEMEVEAWNETVKDLSDPGLPDSFREAWSARAVSMRDDYKAAVVREHSLMGRLLGPKDSGDSQFVFHDPRELHDIAARFDDLDDVVAREIHETRAAEERQRVQAGDERLREVLTDIARRACGGGAVDQADLDALSTPSDPNFF